MRAQSSLVAERAVADERARFARELHDAVGHAVNVMVMQAGAARLVAKDDDRMVDSLRQIEQVGRSALSDLDRMLGLLNDEDDRGAPLEPTRQIDDIGRLVDGMRASGAEIHLTNHCDRSVDDTMANRTGAAAYRIVQEALTNAIKHAGTARIDVTISCTGDQLQVEIVDDGLGAAAPQTPGGGRGIVGMTERAKVLGGQLVAEPVPGGGFRVSRADPSSGAGRAGESTRRLGTMSITVLIVDDDVLVRAGLRMMIETQDDLVVIGEADDGEAAVRLTAELEPDVVLMDIRMSGTDGIEATRQITGGADVESHGKGPRVIILTTFELDEYVYEAVRAGASGFLLKRTEPEDLLDGIRVVAAGDALLAPSVTRRLMSEFSRATHNGPNPTDVRNREIDRLTDREREVFVLIAHGLANREIAAELFVGESTVKTHVKRILMKLELRDRVHAVVFAYESGLLSPGREG